MSARWCAGALWLFGSAAAIGGASVTTAVIGGPGGWDNLAFEPAQHALFVARSDRVQVIDGRTLRLKGEVLGTSGVHGVAFDALHRRGYASNGKSNSVTVFDLDSLERLREIDGVGDGPDAIVYDPGRREIVTFNGRSHDATVIDAVTGRVAATIPLAGKPEFAALDGHGQVFVNDEHHATLVRIDLATRRDTAQWPLTGCDEPTGLAIDLADGRLFSVCSNRTMVVVDAATGAIVDTVAIGDGPDAVVVDEHRHLVLVSNAAGSVTIVARQPDGRYAVTETVPTRPGARTMAIDDDRHTAYTVSAAFEPIAADDPASEPVAARKTMQIPNTFAVLSFDYATRR